MIHPRMRWFPCRVGIDTQAINTYLMQLHLHISDQVTIEGETLPHPFHTTIVNLDHLKENGWLEEEESFLNLQVLVL